VAVGQKAKVANANEPPRQHVEKEAPQELFDRHRDQTPRVLVSRVPPTKRDLAISQGDEPVIGYSDPVGVGTEIT